MPSFKLKGKYEPIDFEMSDGTHLVVGSLTSERWNGLLQEVEDEDNTTALFRRLSSALGVPASELEKHDVRELMFVCNTIMEELTKQQKQDDPTPAKDASSQTSLANSAPAPTSKKQPGTSAG